MSGLSTLDLKPAYHKAEDDIAREFYLPCMRRSAKYDRAVGFFSSSIYVLAWSALRQFVEHGGKIRLICSPVLSPLDAAALEEGFEARLDDTVAQSLQDEVYRLLQNPFIQKPARALAALVAIGVIDVKIATVGTSADSKAKRLFHDKLGIFRDLDQDTVVFKGSMNETWAGLANDGNLETVDVFLSWESGREKERVEQEISYFEALWANKYPKVRVIDFPKVARDQLISSIDPANWQLLIDEISTEVELLVERSGGTRLGARTAKPHQSHALSAWHEQNRRGVLEHATGSGKTFTALCAIREAFENGEVPIILVPSDLLLSQWESEIRAEFAEMDPRLLLCGAGNTRWRTSELLRPWSAPRNRNARVVVATMQTASSADFLRGIQSGAHLFVVADEVHAIGSPKRQALLAMPSGPRLGLSATPRRAGDPDGTSRILEYFGPIVQPPFTLANAIEAGVLTPYVYHVHTVALTETEQRAWEDLAIKIDQLYARIASAGDEDGSLRRRMRRLLIERANIAKDASGKAPVAAEIVERNLQPDDRWIIYCDSQEQVRDVRRLLSARGIRSDEYHSAMAGDRSETLRFFEEVGGVVVSIRCLDEGVDIPSVTHGLILASSKNPREFIQRRGRILRQHPGKYLAHLHDVLVLPATLEASNPAMAVVEGELARAIEFGSGAVNPSAITDLKLLASRFDLPLASLRDVGLEEPDATEEHADG